MRQAVSILLVDDNPDNLLSLEAILEPLNHNLVKAFSGREALKQLLNQDFAVILLDVQMPTMNGFDVARLVRERDRSRHTPIIFLTASNRSDNDIQRGYSIGAVDFIFKPIVPEILRAKVSFFVELFRKTEEVEQLRLKERSQHELERAQNLEALQRSEEQYRLLFERNPLPMWIYDLETLFFLAVNDAAVHQYGYSQEEFLAMTIKEVCLPEDIPFLLDTISKEANLGLNLPSEWKLKKKDGTIIDVEITSHLITFGANSARLVLANDITQHNQVEKSLQARVRQQAAVAALGQQVLKGASLSTLLDEASSLIAKTLEVDYSAVWELLSEDNCLLLRAGVGWKEGTVGHSKIGISMESQIGYTLLMLTQPVIVENFARKGQFHLPSLFREHNVVSGMTVIIHGQKQPFGILGTHTTRQRTFTEDDLNFLQAVANVIATAIERYEAEERIHEQAALLNIAQDAIFVRDLEGSIIFWNKGARNVYGWTAEEAIGENVDSLLHRVKSSQPIESWKSVIESGEWAGLLQQITKEGKEVIVQSRWTLVRDKAGKPKSILIVNTDVTEKKRLEAQLLRAQRMESIGTLAGGIAHDLNNVLAPVLLSMQILKKRINDERCQQILATVEATAQRGTDLVRQVLSFGRGLEGKHTVVQLKHLILEIEKIIRETFPKSIGISVNLTKDLWTLMADATQLHQVLMNLCVNARDAMPNGGMLNISAENILIDKHYAQMNIDAHIGPYIVITVSDTGTGIPPEILDKIFDPFFTTKEIGKGTGLGLSTTINIVKSHGGFLNLYSEVGKGTRFKVYLPAEETTETKKAEEFQAEMPTGRGEWILVVDDEASVREITKVTLETYDYNVLTANDGIEAIALYAQHKDKIKIVLTDMMMPSMDGVTTIRTLQRINPEVKLIPISGLLTNDKRHELASLGITTQLLKPYTAAELLLIIQKVLYSA